MEKKIVFMFDINAFLVYNIYNKLQEKAMAKVKVNRKKAIFHILAFFEFVCFLAVIAAFFIPYCKLVTGGVAGKEQSLFEMLEDIVKQKMLNDYKKPLIGFGMVVVGSLFGLSNILKSRISPALIKFNLFITFVGVVLAGVGVFLCAPSALILDEAKETYEALGVSIKMEAEIGSYLRFAGVGGAVLGFLEGLILRGMVGRAREIANRVELQEKDIPESRPIANVQQAREIKQSPVQPLVIQTRPIQPANQQGYGSQNLEAKLMELKRLKDRGLISEEEYNKKRARVIDMY